MSEYYSAGLQEKIEQYRTKMEEIAQNRSFLPLKYFEQAEGLIRSQILQSIQPKQAYESLQKTLNSWRNELYARNQSAISKWCGELLTETTNTIDKKICREIKSLTTYRQEVFTTIELLRKKTEPYITYELSQLFYEAFLQKAFQHMGQLQNSATTQLQDHLKILEVQNKALSIECKEAKRRTSKEDNEYQRTISELKEKLSLAEVKHSLLEQNAEELRQELHSCQQSKEETIHKLAEDCNTELTQLRAKLQEKYDQAREAIKNTTFVQMELQKEKLLHQQTLLHYQQLMASFHSKQEILKEELLEVSRVSEKEIDHFKLLSTRRIEDWQQTANDLEEQLQQAQKDLKQKESQIFALRQALKSLKETSRIQIDELTKKNADLEYQNKSLQDKESQYQLIKQRMQKMDGQLKKAQRDRDQLNQLCRQTERQRLILEQKHNQMKEELQKERQRHASLQQEFKREIEKREYSKLKRQSQLVNRQSQTDEDINRQKLKAALTLIRQMEADYLKLQQSQYAMRRTFA